MATDPPKRREVEEETTSDGDEEEQQKANRTQRATCIYRIPISGGFANVNGVEVFVTILVHLFKYVRNAMELTNNESISYGLYFSPKPPGFFLSTSTPTIS